MLGKAQDCRPLMLLMICIVIAYLWDYHKYPFMAFYSDWLVIFGITIVFAIFAEQKKPKFNFPSIAVLPGILAVLISVQALFGMLDYAWDSILPLAYFVMATFAVILGATFANSALGAVRLTNSMVLALLVAGFLSVVIATMQLAGLESLLGSFAMQLPHTAGKAIRPYANIGQPNQLALLFCVSIAAVWWLYQRGRLQAVVAFVAVLGFMWGLALTQSRIGWLIIPLFASFVWLWRANIGFKHVSGMALIGLSLGYVALILALPKIAVFLGAVTTPAAARAGTTSVRWVLSQQAWQISLEHPWLGAGWYEFGAYQAQIGADFMPSAYSQHAHNIVLNFAAELGWPVTILVFAILGIWFSKGCLQRRISTEIGFAMLFFMAVMVHSLVEYPLWYAYVLLPMMLLIGMVHQEQFGSRAIFVPRAFVIVVFALMSVGLVSVAMDYRRVVVGFRALGWESLGLVPDEGTTAKPRFTIFPHFYDYFQFAKNKAHEGMSSEEIQFMEHVAKRFSYAPVMMRMSLVYALNARPNDAVRSMMTISRLHPEVYSEAYQVWENMANGEPEKYATIFRRLAKPDLAIMKPKSIP